MVLLKLKSILFVALFLSLLPCSVSANRKYFDNLADPCPYDYGDILMDRKSSSANVKPVFFSHWRHRIKYSCRVCHFELDFAFKKGQTEISEEDNKNGLYCGACHDGTVAFGHTKENCKKCHTAKIISHEKEYNDFLKTVKQAPFGNELDWVEAVESGKINPVYSIYNKDDKPLEFDKKLELAADWGFIPPAYFDHKTHTRWLDCGNCHPDIFNVKKKGTKHFSMKYILDDKFCGVCHISIAFPIDDCKRCHPDWK